MSNPWAPRVARLKRNVAMGATTVRLRESTLDGEGSFLAKIGTELVTISGQSGDTWNVSPAFEEPHGAGAYATEVTIRIVVAGVDHTGVAQNLHDREACPEGEIEATWQITTTEPAAWTPDLDHNPVPFLLLSNELGSWEPFFGGYMGRCEDIRLKGGRHRLMLTGRGAYITLNWDGYDNSNKWAADKAGHTMIQEALAAHGNWVSPSLEHILDAGLQIGQEKDGVGSSPRGLIDFVVNRGDADGQPLDWFVRTDPDGNFKLWVILRSRNPTIEIPISMIQQPAGFVKDYEHRRTKVTIKYAKGFINEYAGGVAGAIRWRYFDYSTQIDNEPLARQVAKQFLTNWNVIDVISSGQVVLQYPIADLSPLQLHRIRAGWFVRFTLWDGGFALPDQLQIKQREADHTKHTQSLTLGRIIEDDLSIGEQFVGKETKLLGSPVSGLIPLGIAPPEGVPYQVGQSTLSAGPAGGISRTKLGADFDVVTSTYNIPGGDDIVPFGRQFPEDKIEIGGRLFRFTLTGNDGDVDSETPGPGTIHVNVYRGHAADLPAIGTLVTTIGIEGDVKGEKDLLEPPATTDAIVELLPGDYLVYEVVPDVDAIKNVAITRMIQRTEGSSRAPSSGGPNILSQSASRDSTTGVITFTITTDRPSTVQIEYGATTNYLSKSDTSEIVRRVTNIPVIGKSPIHWRVIAKDNDGHTSVGADQTF